MSEAINFLTHTGLVRKSSTEVIVTVKAMQKTDSGLICLASKSATVEKDFSTNTYDAIRNSLTAALKKELMTDA